jgi:hypothetical protein
MPVYEYEAEDGSRITRDLPMNKAPRLGSKVKRGGKVYQRIPSVSVQRPLVEGDARFVCYTQRPEDVASPHRVTVGGVEFAAISSKRQIAETVARSDGRISYDRGWGKRP